MADAKPDVPDDPKCIRQVYKDSNVKEFYEDVVDRDARVRQLKELGRFPMPYFANNNRHGETDVYAISWQEPRGEERDAIRARG